MRIYFTFAFLLALASCGGGGGGGGESSSPNQNITPTVSVSISSSSLSVYEGDEITLTWFSTNASSAALLDLGQVPREPLEMSHLSYLLKELIHLP